MTISKNLGKRRYLITNLLLAALFVNLLLFGSRLEMGESFTEGLSVGFGLTWLAYALVGFIILRRRGTVLDERARAIHAKAAQAAFWILLLALSLLAALLRSKSLGLDPEPAELAALLSNLGLATYGLAAFVASRRM